MRAVVISAVHDYRMPRRGSVQAIADALVRAGFDTTFVSVRYSPLALAKRDPRAFLWPQSNRLDQTRAVSCFLWRTPFHPFATGSRLGDRLTEPLHWLFARWSSGSIDAILKQSNVVIVESGAGILLIPRARRLNSTAKIIYLANDALDLIGAHPCLQRALQRADGDISHVSLRARAMAPGFAWASAKAHFVPTGIQPDDFASIGPSPYTGGVNAVSVGSMLLDTRFFGCACEAFPHVRFHLIGAGRKLPARANLVQQDEMPFQKMLSYVAHADFGIAPYLPGPNAAYLAETSLKLSQYAALRRPAVCPDFAVGTHPHRFGYTPGNGASTRLAIEAALRDRFTIGEAPPPTWDDAVARLLEPARFADTAIEPSWFARA